MQYAEPDMTWLEWSTAHDGVDLTEATRLGALREYIFETARDQQLRGEITAEWANKKLATLGITDRLGTNNAYALEVPVSGVLKISVTAANRQDALTEFHRRASRATMVTIVDHSLTGHPVFIDGPEDGPNVVDPDAPTTVDATLEKLREVILLGNIAGPRWNCDSGANRVLASYGLAPVPSRKSFVVTRPASADMRTTVEAYDEASAERVAAWRWDDNRRGYAAHNVDALDEATVTAADNVAS